MNSLLYCFGILPAAAVKKVETGADMTEEPREQEMDAEAAFDIGLILSMINLNISGIQRSSKTDHFFII